MAIFPRQADETLVGVEDVGVRLGEEGSGLRVEGLGLRAVKGLRGLRIFFGLLGQGCSSSRAMRRDSGCWRFKCLGAP